MIYFKRYEAERGAIVAMCDEELIGKVIKEGDIVIDLSKYSGFYKGELVSEEDAMNIFDDDIYSANIVGKRAIEAVVNAGLAKHGDEKTVAGIPFLQIFKID
ncbi:MAG: DUF424 domain-containing protein [Candidatus Micrarchaeia archaeon]